MQSLGFQASGMKERGWWAHSGAGDGTRVQPGGGSSGEGSAARAQVTLWGLCWNSPPRDGAVVPGCTASGRASLAHLRVGSQIP